MKSTTAMMTEQYTAITTSTTSTTSPRARPGPGLRFRKALSMKRAAVFRTEQTRIKGPCYMIK